MTTAAISKPEIRTRKMKFDFEDVNSLNYWNGNSIVSSFFAAMSATFPLGEKEFIESVRMYKDRISDPELQKEIKAFIGQEGHHSFQHRQLNDSFEKQGWDTHRIEDKLRNKLALYARHFSPETRLARTVCFEHITAIMSEFMLGNPDIFEGIPEELTSLLLWHSVEEIEHKSVAFDVYETVVADRAKLRRQMVVVTIDFTITMLYYQIMAHVWARSLPSWSDIKGALSFFFGKKGMLKTIVEPYMRFYQKDFTPWDEDDSELIDAWKASKYASNEILPTAPTSEASISEASITETSITDASANDDSINRAAAI